jgi:hypothetical protein
VQRLTYCCYFCIIALATWGVDEFCISISWIFNWIKANFVMTDNNLKKWYVVRAVSGQENKVKAYIEKKSLD